MVLAMPRLNSLAAREQAAHTPSNEDGIPSRLEEQLRAYGCQRVQQASILLRLPQVTMSTAQVLFQRFWYVSSMRSFSIEDMVMGSLLLSSKLAETPLGLRDLVNVCDYLAQRALYLADATEEGDGSGNRSTAFKYKPMDYFSDTFYDAKDALVVAEMQLLKRLGFHVQVSLPHPLMINYMQVLGLADTKLQPRTAEVPRLGAMQCAWNYLNDAYVPSGAWRVLTVFLRLQTPVYCLFPPHILACASIYMLTLRGKQGADSNPYYPLQLPLYPHPWWELFDASEAELRVVATYVLRLYDANKAGATDKPSPIHGPGAPALARLCTKGGMRDFLRRHELGAHHLST